MDAQAAIYEGGQSSAEPPTPTPTHMIRRLRDVQAACEELERRSRRVLQAAAKVQALRDK